MTSHACCVGHVGSLVWRPVRRRDKMSALPCVTRYEQNIDVQSDKEQVTRHHCGHFRYLQWPSRPTTPTSRPCSHGHAQVQFKSERNSRALYSSREHCYYQAIVITDQVRSHFLWINTSWDFLIWFDGFKSLRANLNMCQ